MALGLTLGACWQKSLKCIVLYASFSFTYSSSSLGKSLLVCCNHHLTAQIASPAANQNENLLACLWSYSPKAVSYICHKIGIPPIRQHAPFSPAHDSGLEPSRPSLSLSNPIKSLNQVYKPRFPAIYGKSLNRILHGVLAGEL